ncbi:winged helix-turn-helix domain-containing protein [Natrialba asiatica]|uniref:ArsR family transcriptional regulator n=1 Tax=Natrialba asiatica (strain ATCC 700177 / DSM 12278 / JCM 9576 / FERM P-10747 / NBRC 102637 / 172P1) TaxID=29540 RepID=M0APD6_NATA1|nr:helix-turn-helix domain-containing protein [Natrialba asiatica]ELZ00561.1 hypothetical protein C481_12994 [Natrialba asiatica DSM 12278]
MSLDCPNGETPPLAAIIDALDDPGCRAIIALLETPQTAREIADETDLPLSTAYRKLDRLRDAALIAETTERHRGRHDSTRYVATFDRIDIELDDDHEFSVDLGRAATQSLELRERLRQQ